MERPVSPSTYVVAPPSGPGVSGVWAGVDHRAGRSSAGRITWLQWADRTYDQQSNRLSRGFIGAGFPEDMPAHERRNSAPYRRRYSPVQANPHVTAAAPATLGQQNRVRRR